jgi:HEAT repeat protein
LPHPNSSQPSKHNPESLTIKQLIEDLSSFDFHTRRQSIRLLGQIGPKAKRALPLVREALTDSHYVIRLEAAIAIGFIGTTKEVPHLLPLLDDDVSAVRFQTISALAFLRDPKITPELVARYEQEEPQIQDQILRAIGQLGGKEAFPLLQKELYAENPKIRIGAVVGLEFLGDARAEVLLRKAANDSHELVAHEARIALLHLNQEHTKLHKK